MVVQHCCGVNLMQSGFHIEPKLNHSKDTKFTSSSDQVPSHMKTRLIRLHCASVKTSDDNPYASYNFPFTILILQRKKSADVYQLLGLKDVYRRKKLTTTDLFSNFLGWLVWLWLSQFREGKTHHVSRGLITKSWDLSIFNSFWRQIFLRIEIHIALDKTFKFTK